MNTNRFKQLLESKMGNVKPLLSEELTTSLKGGWIKLNDGTTEKKGCVKFVKFTKKDGTWKRVDSWAQGVTDHEGNSTKSVLGIPLPIKFNFSWLISTSVPDNLEKITLPISDVQSMFTNWKSGSSYKKTIYSKGTKKVDSESLADTKFELYFGGTDVNNYCKTEWS